MPGSAAGGMLKQVKMHQRNRHEGSPSGGGVTAAAIRSDDRKGPDWRWGWGLLLLWLLTGGAGCSRKPRKELYLERGERFQAKANYPKAEVDFLHVLATDFGNVRAMQGLGAIYLDEGRLPEAAAVLERAAELAPNDVSIRLRRGIAFLSFGEWERARNDAYFVLDHRPDEADAALVVAESARTPAEQAAALQKLARYSPPNARHAGVEAAEAALYLRRQPPDLEAAQAAMQVAVALAPNSSVVQSVRGFLSLANNDVVTAQDAFRQAAELAPPYSPRRLRYAQFLTKQGDLKGALEVLRGLVKLAPENMPAWLALAQTAYDANQFDEAAPAVSEVLQRNSADHAAHLLSGKIALARGQAAAAATELEALAVKFPKEVVVQTELARACMALAEWPRAAAALHQILSLEPTNRTARLALAQVDLERGELAAGIYTLKQMVRQEPDWDQAKLLLARGYQAQGDNPAATQVYRELATNRPSQTGYLLALGGVLMQQGKRAEARTAWNEALKTAPRFPADLPAIENLVRLDLNEKNTPAARERVEALVAEAPQAAAAHYWRAQVALAEHTPTGTNQAEASFRKARELQTNYWSAYLALADLYQATGRAAPAVAQLREILAQNPRSIETWLRLGVILASEKDYPGARDCYEEVLKIAPRNTGALNNAAYLYAEKLVDLDRAHKYSLKARELLPTDPSVADTCGWIDYLRGDYSQALPLLEESAGKLGSDPEVRYHLGMVHYQLGHEPAAVTNLLRAVELGLTGDRRAEAEQCRAVLGLASGDTNPAAAALLEQRLATRPGDAVALDRLGSLRAAAGDTNAALATFQKARTAGPLYLPAILHLAELQAGPFDRPAAGLELALTAYKLVPADPRTARLAGQLALRTGDYVQAFGLLDQAARTLPKDGDLQYEVALAAYLQGDLSQAVTAARRSAQNPTASPRQAEAKLFLQLADPAAPPATPELIADALRSATNFLPALMARARAAENKKDLDAARQGYGQILATYPKFIPAVRQLALLSAAVPELTDQAVRLGLQALAAQVNDPDLFRAVGLAAFGKDDFEHAEHFLKLASSKPGDDARLWYCLGVSQSQTKRKTESVKSLRRALDQGLSGKEAVEARRILLETKR